MHINLWKQFFHPDRQGFTCCRFQESNQLFFIRSPENRRCQDDSGDCLKVLVKPLLIVGVSALFYWVIRLVESLCRVKFIICICTISSLLINLGFLCFMVFSILVAHKSMSRALFGRRDGDFSHYLLEKYVLNAEQIKSCLLDFKTCQHLPTGKGADHFYKYSQLSCCMPPIYCGLEFHNATYWIIPKAGPAVANNDCKIWNNIQTELCFKCQSCKTIFYDIIKKGWKKLSLISFVMLFLLCCVQCYYLIWFINWSKGHPWQRVYRA